MNIERKRSLVEDGRFKHYMSARRVLFEAGKGELAQDPGAVGLTEEDIKDCERIRRARKEQRQKIEDHLKYWISRKDVFLLFGTFTFSDDVLSSTAKDTRRQYVRRVLQNLDDYMMNIDYGTENGREHYHALLCVRKEGNDLYTDESGHLKTRTLDRYTKGFYSIEPIETNAEDIARLKKYMTKLVMHSVKVEQTYISTKKGSPYQKWKADQEKRAEMRKHRAGCTEETYETESRVFDRWNTPTATEWYGMVRDTQKEKSETVQIDFCGLLDGDLYRNIAPYQVKGLSEVESNEGTACPRLTETAVSEPSARRAQETGDLLPR